MRSWSWSIALSSIALPLGILAGTWSGPAALAPSAGASTVGHAQIAGGLGSVLPSEGPAALEPSAPSPPSAAGAGMAPADPARFALAQQRGQQASPLVQGLESNPDLLMQLMRSIRDDPAMRQEALQRMRSSGGLVGVGAGAVSDEALQGTLDGLLSDPDRLKGILGVLGANPQLLGGMLGGMGLEGVTPGEINQVLGQLGGDPAALQGLLRGDTATAERLAAPMTGIGAASAGAGGGQTAPMDLDSLTRMLQQAQSPGAAPQGPTAGLGALGGLAGLGGGGVDPAMASQLLGTGASLSLLADMLGVFGGSGPEMAHLQASLRSGDVQSLLSMVQGIYGPDGSLSREMGTNVNSYTDLLNALMSDGDDAGGLAGGYGGFDEDE